MTTATAEKGVRYRRSLSVPLLSDLFSLLAIILDVVEMVMPNWRPEEGLVKSVNYVQSLTPHPNRVIFPRSDHSVFAAVKLFLQHVEHPKQVAANR